MSTTLRFEGLDELRAELRTLPAHLTGEGGHLVEAATNGAAVLIKAEYGKHRVTGDLVDKVTSDVETSGFGVIGTVKSGSTLAYIFENGTEARHYITVNGQKHLTGRMPPMHIFVPTMQRERRRMYAQLKALLERAGLEVSDDGAA